MSLPIGLLLEARDELDAAIDWYEQQRAGLGTAFLDRVRDVFARIAANPQLHATVYEESPNGQGAFEGGKVMSEAVALIVAQLPSLSQEERAALAHAVLLSMEPEDPNAEEAWDKELTRRAARIRSGEATGIPAEQVFAEWRRGRS